MTSRSVYGRARFAGLGSAWPLLWPSHGVYLGHAYGRPLLDPGPTHTLVVAPTRAGKGVGFVIPQLLGWPHSLLAFDPKAELCSLTAAWRQRYQPTAYWGPSRYSARWSPTHELAVMTEADRSAAARTVAATLAEDAEPGFWSREAVALLHWLLLYAATRATVAPLAAVHDLLQTLDAESLERIQTDAVPQPVRRGASDLLAKSGPERSGVRSTALSFLRSLQDLRVREATSQSDLLARTWFQTSQTLYVCATPQDLTAHGPLIKVFWRYWLEQAMSAEPLAHPLLCLIDEFSFLARSPIWDTVAKFGAGFHLRAALVCQSLGQIDNDLVANLHNKLFFATSDLATAKFLSEYAGQRTTLLDKNRPVAQHLLSPTEARKSRPLLLRGTLDPLRVRLPPFYKTHLARRVRSRPVPSLDPAPVPSLHTFFPHLDPGPDALPQSHDDGFPPLPEPLPEPDDALDALESLLPTADTPCP